VLDHFNLYVAAAGLLVGFTVGLTGMGGGALMTPIMVLVFGVQPLAAVSSDLVASFVMKPVGSLVHLRRGTVHRSLVTWLMIGSVPSAFLGVLLLRSFGEGPVVQQRIRSALAAALLLAVVTIVAKACLGLRRSVRERRAGVYGAVPPVGLSEVPVRRAPTLLVGVVGGLVVGMTSVGSGSLIIVALLLMYPRLRASQLVGTDLVQAVPLVGSAALGHVLFGDFQLGLTGSVLVGSLPGVYLGARVSAAAPGRLVRRALMIVLFASGLKLADVSTAGLGWVLLVCVTVVPLGWVGLRVALGLPARVPEPRAAPVRATVSPVG
jgi:uncharacterized membrane protein YfcA